MTPGTDTSWIAGQIPDDEAMRLAAVRACREGVSPNEFLALSPVEHRGRRAKRLRKQRLQGFGNCWAKVIQGAAQAQARSNP